jgi:hypothetical protein
MSSTTLRAARALRTRAAPRRFASTQQTAQAAKDKASAAASDAQAKAADYSAQAQAKAQDYAQLAREYGQKALAYAQGALGPVGARVGNALGGAPFPFAAPPPTCTDDGLQATASRCFTTSRSCASSRSRCTRRSASRRPRRSAASRTRTARSGSARAAPRTGARLRRTASGRRSRSTAPRRMASTRFVVVTRLKHRTDAHVCVDWGDSWPPLARRIHYALNIEFVHVRVFAIITFCISCRVTCVASELDAFP